MAMDPIPSPFAAGSPGEGGLDMGQMGNVLLRKAWLIVLLGILGAFSGFYYLKTRPRIYFSQAILQVEPQEGKVAPFQQPGQADMGADDMIEGYVATLKSRPFLARVVRDQKLTTNSDFVSMAPGGSISEDQAVNALMGAEEIQPRPNTHFIEVGIRHPNPRVAQFLANALCKELDDQGMEGRHASSQDSVDFLEAQAKQSMEEVTQAEEEQEKYVETHHSISLQQAQDTVVGDLRHGASELQSATSDTLRLQADEEAVKRAAGDEEALLVVPSVADNPVIIGDRQRIADLESQIAALSVRYNDPHPKMIMAHSQLQEAKARLSADLADIPNAVHTAYESSLVRQEKFKLAEAQREDEATKLNQLSIVYNVLHGNLDIKRATYASLLKQLSEAKINSGIDSNPLHIFEVALLPDAPMVPSKVKVLAIAIAAGMAVGAGIAVGLNALDSSLKSVEQAERLTGLPVAGAIPVASRRLARSGLILQRDPGSSVAEAFRSLRTFLFFKGRHRRPKTILFTSALPGEGKTFCSINCAVSLAQQGLRTVLIDADLRAPAVARILLPDDHEEGLTAVLEGGLDFRKALRHLEMEGLFLLPGGHIAGNPAELLATPEFGNLISELEEQFDCVVIDSAPIIPVCDTLLLVTHAQSVCLVVHANKTARKAVLRTTRVLAEAGASMAGILLNMLSPKTDPDHYVYRQKYGSRENYGEAFTGRPLTLPGPKREPVAPNGASHENGSSGDDDTSRA